MLFEEKLKMLRKEQNLTQEKLAEKLNVSRQAITKWETGEGTPDIENLKQISKLFNVTIDELIKEEKNINLEESIYTEELEIDHTKHFDIKISENKEINILPNNKESVKIKLISNEDLEKSQIKFDNLYNKLDIDIKNKEVKDFIVNIYLPEKYIDEIELNTKSKTLNIADLKFEKLEYDGTLKNLNVKNTKAKITLNTTKCDIEAAYDKFAGTLEINTINSTSRVEIPKETKYKTVLKGVKNKFIDANSDEEAENIIELNGIGSKLIIIEK